MKAWTISRYGGPHELKLNEAAMPIPKDEEVLVQIKAASVNPVDFRIRKGNLKPILPYRFPLILGNDCAGVIVETGKHVAGFKMGDEVFTRPPKNSIGTFAEYISVKADAVALKPQNTSFEEAASLPLVGLTAWQALFEKGRMKAGERVFIPGGSGGVGSLAIQLAKHFGATVITNTSNRNLDFVRSLGVDEVFEYSAQKFWKAVNPVDIVLDTLGGFTQKKAFAILKAGGKLVSITGPPTRDFAEEIQAPGFVRIASGILSIPAQVRSRRAHGSYHFLFMHPDGDQLSEIAKLVETRKIKPVLDRIFSFSKVDEAIAYVEQGHARGKVVVSMEE